MAMPVVRKMTGGCGAEVLGVDLARLSNGDMELVRQAFADFGVLFFRDQRLTPEEHIAFARRWDEIDINRFFPADSRHPEIAEVRKEKDQKTNIGRGWHTDHSYDQTPAMGSVLVARELPEEGGDTLFADMYAAYDDLSDAMKKMLAPLNAVHSAMLPYSKEGFYANEGKARSMTIMPSDEAKKTQLHPVVRTHPETDHKCLYVNRVYTIGIEGMTREEGEALIGFLTKHSTQEKYVYRHKWRPDMLTMWDNRCVQHYADGGYDGHRRLMYRTTTAGDRPR